MTIMRMVTGNVISAMRSLIANQNLEKEGQSRDCCGSERWNCADCEFDICQSCAGVSRAEFEAWDSRVQLLSSLSELPKRWWVNSRSNPLRWEESDDSRRRARKRVKNSGGALSRASSIISTGSWDVPAIGAALTMVPSGVREQRSSGQSSDGFNMGPSVVGKAIEVQWGRNADWFAGLVVEFLDGQHHISYNNGETEWVTLYRDFDNGVKWQLLPQVGILASDEHGTLAPGIFELNDEFVRMNGKASKADSAASDEQKELERNKQARQYNGVHSMNGMFHASVRLWDRDISLGFYDTALEAAVAHDQGMELFYGVKRQVPLNFKNGKREAVRCHVASLLASNKQKISKQQLDNSAESVKQSKPEDVKSDEINRLMNIPNEAATTMMGFDPAAEDVCADVPHGRSRHQLLFSDMGNRR